MKWKPLLLYGEVKELRLIFSLCVTMNLRDRIGKNSSNEKLKKEKNENLKKTKIGMILKQKCLKIENERKMTFFGDKIF